MRFNLGSKGCYPNGHGSVGQEDNCAAKSAPDRRSPAPMKSSLPVELLEDCEATNFGCEGSICLTLPLR